MAPDSLLVTWLPGLGLALALACLWAALRAGKRKRLVDDLPTSKTTGVFIGLVELKGTAEAEMPLTSYLAATACVAYDWSIQEHWSRTVIETYTDSQGRPQTRTRTESSWTTIAQGNQCLPFYLKDDCGVIRIEPEGARLEPQTVMDQTCGRADPLYYGKGPGGAVANSDHRRRFHETAIPLHAALYVMGQARERPDVVAPEIAQDRNAPLFLISTRSEAAVSAEFRWSFLGWTALGLVLAVAGWFARDLARGADPQVRWPHYGLAGAGYLGAAALGWVWMVFNSLIDLRQRVRQAWAQVDVQLQRRHDLIPELVQMVKGLRDYERTLQTEVAELRSQLAATPPGEPGPDYRACTKMLVAIAERYPELKTQESFANLRKNLVDTEQRIALARAYFNDIATFYNTRLEIVPDRWIAALGALRVQALMAANDFERAPVPVALAG
ncbi:MAG: LemA family protein [Verrucomicrobia bacterium]|nr:LemA family protein [Verrucomicrobiota bacterium]